MNISRFLSEAKTEFKHINWPTKKEGWKLTMTVIGISLILAILLGIFDNLFLFLLRKFIFKI